MKRLTKLIGISLLFCSSNRVELESNLVEPVVVERDMYVIYDNRGIVRGLYSDGTNTPTVNPGWKYEKVEPEKL
jgi:hypothetical protein